MSKKKSKTLNFPIFIVSAITACILWLFVINTQNPVHTQQIKDVPLTIVGIDDLRLQGVVLQNESELNNLKVKVTLKGPRLKIEQILNNPKLKSLKLDVSQMLTAPISDTQEVIEKTKQLELYLSVPGVTVERIEPEIVPVNLEPLTEKNVSVEVVADFTSVDGIQPLDPIVKPSTVKVSGGMSSVNSVASAITEVNIKNITADSITYTLPVKLLDSDGHVLENMTPTPESVEVTLPIGETKTVPVVVSYDKSSLGSDYALTRVVSSISEITIIGKSDVIQHIESIHTESIDLSDINGTETISTSLSLPDGVKIFDDASNTLEITVTTRKKNQYQLNLNTKNIVLKETGLDPSLTYKILTEQLAVEFVALPEDILGFNLAQSIVGIDLTNLPVGIHQVPLTFTSTNSVAINAPNPLTIEIIKKD